MGSLKVALTPVAALLLGTALLYAGFGLQMTLVPLRAGAEGFDDLQLGLLGASYSLGFVGGCVLAPRLILRAGHIRAFAAMVSMASAAAIAFPLYVDPLFWNLCRIVLGFCISGLYVAIESWLNDKATNTTRGVVMSAYVVVSFAMITVGQLLVTTYALEHFALFTIASVLFSLAAIPVTLTASTQPTPVALARFRPWRLMTVAPAAFAGALSMGLIQGAFWSLGPAFATQRGFSSNEAAVFMSVAVMGGALGQWPLGRASDFVDRRKVIVAAMAGAAVSGILLWQLASLGATAMLILGFLFGAFVLPSYSLAVAHAFDWTPREDMVETSASIIALFGVGAIVGPLIAPTFMKLLGGSALFLYMAIVAAVLVAFVAYRITRRPAPASETKSDFDIYSTAPVGGAITPDPLDPDMEGVELPHITPGVLSADEVEKTPIDNLEDRDELVAAGQPKRVAATGVQARDP